MDENTQLLMKQGYILECTLGEGTYGKVKSAYSKELKKKVAIKIIDQTKATDEVLQKFLPRELEILPLLDHPNIIKTFKILHTRDKKIFIVMELGMQGNMRDLINARKKLSEELSKKLFHQLALAVQFLHERNIVHRDLKCENLLLDTDFNLKVADFGFSKILEYKHDQVVLSATFCGSAAYASPELLQRIPYNPKISDMWSMGVVLFIMLTGFMPYDDSNLTRMVAKQKAHAIHFPHSVKENCKDACNLIISILHPNPFWRININQILQHPWLGKNPKVAKGTQREWTGPSTSKSCTEDSKHKKDSP